MAPRPAKRVGGPRRRAPRARPLLAAALAAVCSCSFIAVRRPTPGALAPGAPLECTQSRLSPVLDTVGAVAVPLFGLTLWGLCSYTSTWQSWSSNPVGMQCGPVLWGTILSTAAYTGSALYGFHATADCRRLAEERRASMFGPWAPPEPGR